MWKKKSVLFYLCLSSLNCSSSQYIVNFGESDQVQLHHLFRLNEITKGNHIEIIMENGSIFKGFGFQANLDSCRFWAGDINNYEEKIIATQDIARIYTSSKIIGGGIIIGSALSGLTFFIFKDNPNLDSFDHFLLVGGSFLVGTAVGESFSLIPIKKKVEIQFINSADNLLEN